jgi:hypothetical protein
MPRAGEVLHTWRRWIRTVSNRTMSCGRRLQLPPLPELPAPLRGQAFVAVEVAHQGDVAELNKAVSPLRDLGPVMDTITEIPTARLAELHMDPPGPTPCRGNGMLLNDVPRRRSTRWSPAPVMDPDRHSSRWSYATSVVPLPNDPPTQARWATSTPNSPCTPSASPRTQPPLPRSMPTCRLSSGHSAHGRPAFTTRTSMSTSAGGRDRFHDRATLERLRAVKSRVDQTGLFTCGHPVTSPSMPATWVAGQSQPGGSH